MKKELSEENAEREQNVITQSILNCIEFRTITPQTEELTNTVSSVIKTDEQVNGELTFIESNVIAEVEEFFEGSRYAYLNKDNMICCYSKDNKKLYKGYIVQNSKDSYIFFKYDSTKGTIGIEIDIRKTNKWLNANSHNDLNSLDFDMMVYINWNGLNWVYDKS